MSVYLLAQTGDSGSTATNQPEAAPTPTPAPAETPAITQQDGSAPTSETPVKPPADKGWGSMIPLVLMFVVIYFFMFRGPRKRQQEQKKMMDSIQKGTRIRTIGGILGTVVDVREDQDEVVVKVDEATNTKIRLIRSAIGKVFTDDEKSN